MKLTSSEIKFLRDRRQEINNNNFQKLISDFGNPQRLIEILKSIGIQVPKDLANIQVNKSYTEYNKPQDKLNIVKMRFPTIDDYYDMPAHLRRYYDNSQNEFYWYFALDTHTNEFKVINYANGNIEDADMRESAFRPVLEIPNLTKVYPNNAVGDFIPIETDYMDTTDHWIEIDDDKVIYAGKLHNIILDDADLEIRDWFKNIKELNK